MKKLVVMLLCLNLIGSLSSCNLDEHTPNDETTDMITDQTTVDGIPSDTETDEIDTSDGTEKSGAISAEEALQLAKQYWERYDIERNGYIVVHAENSDAPSSVYVIVIKRRVVDRQYSTFDEIWIDVNTGKAIVPHASEDTESIRAVSAEEARTIASAYWNIEDGAKDYATGKVIEHRIIVLDGQLNGYTGYYHVIWQSELSHAEYVSAEDEGVYHVYLNKELLVNAMTGECVPYVANDGK